MGRSLACLQLLLVLVFLPVPAAAGRQPVAGWAEERAAARVTGKPAPSWLVKQVALEASWPKIHPARGAAYTYSRGAQGARALLPGEACVVTLSVRLTAPGKVAVDARVRVRVRCEAVLGVESTRLLFSNHPESVTATGLLYQASAEPGSTNRLFLHHENRTARPLRILAHLTNPGSEPVECLITEAIGGPHRDPILAGHRAAVRFLDLYKDGVGRLVRIPPRSVRVVLDRRAARLQTVSGVIDVRPLSGGPLVCQVRAETQLALPPAGPALLEEARKAIEVYSPAQKQVSGRYAVGGGFLFVAMGKTPVPSLDGQRCLLGNYGVLYTFDIELTNPLPAPHDVHLAISPRGGWARGAFLYQGKVIETAGAGPPRESPITSVRLAPNQTRRIVLSSLPAGGSFYPTWLVARANVPQAMQTMPAALAADMPGVEPVARQ